MEYVCGEWCVSVIGVCMVESVCVLSFVSVRCLLCKVCASNVFIEWCVSV